MAQPLRPNYSTSKAAIALLSKALAREFTRRVCARRLSKCLHADAPTGRGRICALCLFNGSALVMDALQAVNRRLNTFQSCLQLQ